MRVGTSCAQAGNLDRVRSTGHSASPQGLDCRVISRQSIGRYYPVFNQICTGDGPRAQRIDLHVDDPEHIALERTGSADRISYRYCPTANRGAN